MKQARVNKNGFLLIMALSIFSIGVCAAFGSISGSVAASAGVAEQARVPIIMYHSLLKDASRHGKYVLSPDAFEQDLAYLRDNGYTAVLASDLAAFVYEGRELPDKPVVISFDDAYLNTLTYALPLLEEYDMKAVVSVVGEYTETSSATEDHNPNYSYMNWDDIRQVVATGRVEIGNHSYSMHKNSGNRRNGIVKMRGEDDKLYADMLSLDLLKLQDALYNNCGIRPIVFAYPFGAPSDEAYPVIKAAGFRVSFLCTEKVNVIDQNEPDSLYCLGRFNRPSGISTEQFMKRLNK